ncbi:FeS assembly protein IscX [Rickettsia endosymbiont of Gonocerus acuteangulatus]|uniref:FeS assembly protein IscX n=1 Tax=Rickettsia endosymbiont of Gonocerus acuteangulatus TaxID=3066266 RepID=UPI0031332186
MHWHELDIEEITEQLEDNYHDQYNDIKLSGLKRLIESLIDSESFEGEIKEITLEEILERWGEIREENE